MKKIFAAAAMTMCFPVNVFAARSSDWTESFEKAANASAILQIIQSSIALFVILGLDDELLVAVDDVDDLLVLADLAVQGLGLRVELVGELPGLDVLVCGIVVDTLLGVECYQLSAHGPGLKDKGAHHLGPSIDPGGETCRSGSDNHYVVCHPLAEWIML